MTHQCPYCLADMQISISQHALERLEERAYLKFFRTFKLGEDKYKWLMRYAATAIEQGVLLISDEPGSTKYWFAGIEFVFKKAGKTLVLATLFLKNQPRKRYWDTSEILKRKEN